ncbi:MAG: hypothetical protein ACREXX_05090 [Gammaproteobacteria bacterium]
MVRARLRGAGDDEIRRLVKMLVRRRALLEVETGASEHREGDAQVDRRTRSGTRKPERQGASALTQPPGG